MTRSWPWPHGDSPIEVAGRSSQALQRCDGDGGPDYGAGVERVKSAGQLSGFGYAVARDWRLPAAPADWC